MLSAICIAIAALAVVSLVAVIVRSRRTAKNPATDVSRHRAVLGDCGDDVIWEVGKMRPIVAPKEFEERLSKRSFLKRAAFTVSAFSVAWLASRGKSVAFGSERSAENPLSGQEKPSKEYNHSDSTYHSDLHTDSNGSGPNHADSHTDTGNQHTDQ